MLTCTALPRRARLAGNASMRQCSIQTEAAVKTDHAVVRGDSIKISFVYRHAVHGVRVACTFITRATKTSKYGVADQLCCTRSETNMVGGGGLREGKKTNNSTEKYIKQRTSGKFC